MATYAWANPVITITLTPTEAAVIQRVLGEGGTLFQDMVNSWLVQKYNAFNAKDVQSVQTFLSTASPATIAQIMAALNIPQV
jgi:hypothetical protein